MQLYLRDPAGNLVEVDWPDATHARRETLAESMPLESTVAQDGEAARATLYHAAR